ncbi:MAG: family 16 glycosylhydrolase [Burkholderiales bacterium]|nr:family 16 glycosylhydrolase [Phycisphaerae bacterium]
MLQRLSISKSSLVVAAIAGVMSGANLHAAPPSTSYKLAFADEFNGSTLDTYKWNYNYSWGNTHNHRAYMDPAQVIVSGGQLNLKAIAQRHPSAPSGVQTGDFGWQSLDYTAGAINSQGKFNMTRGYIEASVKMQDTLGSWPAFWMLQNGWPPEIDIMEFPRGTNNSKTQSWQNYHYTNASNAHASYGWQDGGPDLTAGFNTFGVEWTATQMKFYFNGSVRHTINDAAAIADSAGMYMILNHAIGGWAGTPAANNLFPVDYLTEYVRVWQLPPSTATTVNWLNTSASGSWDTGSKWDTMVPSHQDVVARFGANNNASVNVTWDNSRTAGGLVFDSDKSFTVGDSNAGLQLTKTSGTATIDVPATNTAAHTIAARLELYNNTLITNNSAQALTLSGVVTGTGGLIFDGTGTVLIANSNSYTGDTFIDSGGQGPAVVRINKARPFGTTGTVRFNEAGNGTTGRIEMMDSREIPNPIMLSGRTNASAAIQNISGNNLVSGKITLGVGGGNYVVQSDAGTLTLSGTAAGAGGIALTSLATGQRTFTLQGAGNGLVTGIIQNGLATLNILKQGPGQWTFANVNTYTGTTTVTDGKLVMSQAFKNNAPVAISNNATVEIAANGLYAGVSHISALTIPSDGLGGYAGKLELHDNDLVIDYTLTPTVSPYATTLNMVKKGLLLLGGNGMGIASSKVDAQTLSGTMLAVVDNGAVGGQIVSLSGYSGVTTKSVLVKYTWRGDANLDGVVNGSDYALADTGFSGGGTGWFYGDVNYDGLVNGSDYALMDTGFSSQSGPLPEPSVLGLLGVGLLALRRRTGRCR